MKQRSKLKILGYVLMGALSSSMLMLGGSSYASTMSTEDIIRWAIEKIVSYVIGESYEIFMQTIEDYAEKMKELYGSDSEDIGKTISTDGISTDSHINVLKTIYDSTVTNEGLPIEASCHGNHAYIGRAFENASLQRSSSDAISAIQTPRVTADIAVSAFTDLREVVDNPGTMPSNLDAARYLTRRGYETEVEYDSAKSFVRAAIAQAQISLDYIEKIAHSSLQLSNPAVLDAVISKLSLMENAAYPIAFLNDLVNDRRRDSRAHVLMAKELSQAEIELLKPHATEAGVSKIDLVNFEADVAAHNTARLNDILYTDTQSSESPLAPTAVRAYKYLAKQKALQNAMKIRVSEQQKKLETLTAIVTQLRVSETL